MRLIPSSERSSIDLHHSRLGNGIRTDEFVVRWVIGDTNDTSLARAALTPPGEITGVETKGSEFAVAATGADKMDALGTDTGVGRLTTFLESSV
jgi:hypothetical protein